MMRNLLLIGPHLLPIFTPINGLWLEGDSNGVKFSANNRQIFLNSKTREE